MEVTTGALRLDLEEVMSLSRLLKMYDIL